MTKSCRFWEPIIVTTIIVILSTILVYQFYFNRDFLYRRAELLYQQQEYKRATSQYIKFLSRFSNGQYVSTARETFFRQILPEHIRAKRERMIPLALKALSDDRSIVRHEAAMFLGNVADLATVPALVEAFNNDPDQWVRDSAELALMHVGMNVSIKPGSNYSRFLAWWEANVGKMNRPPGMVFVPEGEFIYGAGKKESLPPFYADKFEVTNAQYKKFVEATGHKAPTSDDETEKTYGWKNEGYPLGKANHPVVLVSRRDATAFAKWSGKRLPTRKEWEKAMRGTDGRDWPQRERLNNTKCNAFHTTTIGTAPVGSYPDDVSPFGCYDVIGNVSEWTDSLFNGNRAAGGLSWSTSPELVKVGSPYLIIGIPPWPDSSTGFRCVISPEPKPIPE